MLKINSNNGWLTLRYLVSFASLFLLVATLAVALWFRIQYINETFGGITGCNNCFVKNVLIFDGPYLGALVILYLASLITSRWWLYLSIRFAVLVGVVAYIADYILGQNLYTRLMIGDIQTYGTQVSLIWDHIVATGILAQDFKWIIGTAGLLVIVLLGWPPVPLNRKAFAFALLPLLLIIVCLSSSPTIYVHNWAMYNLVTVNFSPGEAVDYSDEYRRAFLENAAYTSKFCPEENTASQGDIVLLILESWSPYQSQLWGGEYDWTPKIDDIARQNLWFSNFYAGGFVTNEGLSSILAGTEFYSPVTQFFKATMFEGLWNLDSTVPKVLNRAGYFTAFLTTGDLSFGDKGEWFANIGFDYIEGHDFAGYEGLPRLHFRSAADEHLYARALDFLDAETNKESRTPLFLTIENVSTHQPFIHPHTREADKESVFRYMDQTVADFYKGLQERNFFARGGLLVVVSDHRSMTPISKVEDDNFGQLAASRIPAFIVYNQAPVRAVNAIYHQSDILPTLQKYVSPSCAVDSVQNLLSPAEASSRCVLHARGDQRNYIDVVCSDGNGRVQLNGDATDFIETGNITPLRQKALLERINSIRIQQQANHRRYQALKNKADEQR